jgi:flagellar protein FlaG
MVMEINPVQGIREAVAAAPVSVPPQQAAENREVVQAVRAINQSELFGHNNELTFTMDRGTKRPVTKIVDRNTGEVIRQIPAEYVLRMAEELGKLYG